MPKRSRSRSVSLGRRLRRRRSNSRGRSRRRQSIPSPRNTSSPAYRRGFSIEAPQRRERTWGEYALQTAASSAAGALAGYATGGNPMAVDTAAALVYDATAPNLNVSQTKTSAGTLMGVYQGAVNKPLKSLSASQLKVLPYLNRGSFRNFEFYGNVYHPDAVYFGHNTFSPQLLAPVIAEAVVRKLLKIIGWNSNNTQEEPPLISASDSGYSSSAGFRIQWEYRSAGSGPATTQYDIPFDQTLSTIAENSGLKSIFLNQMIDSDPVYIDKICIYEIIKGLTIEQEYRLRGTLEMKREVIKIHCSSTFTFQNRTLNDQGSTLTNTSNQNPVYGTHYHFIGSVPQAKNYATYALNSITPEGIILKTPAELTPSDSWREPPHPKQFNNCVKNGRMVLEPGVMKTMYLESNYSGFVNNIMGRKLKFQKSANPSLPMIYGPGKCDLIGAHEVMNSGRLNDIIIAYECKKSMGCYLITTKDTPILPSYESEEFTYTPPE